MLMGDGFPEKVFIAYDVDQKVIDQTTGELP